MTASRPVARRIGAKPLPASVERFVRQATPLGPVVARPMFGGYGIYLDGLMFAIGADDRIWLKVDGETKPLFVAASSCAFVYAGKNRAVEMSYWSFPEAEDVDGAAFLRWTGLALAAARRNAASKRGPAAALRPAR
ncbi:MAG: TfoX/Sxy family protein [Dongiaceae bacterium]